MLIISRNKWRELVAFDGAARRLVNAAIGVGSAARTSRMSAFYELIYRKNINGGVGGLMGFESPLFFGAGDLHEVVDASEFRSAAGLKSKYAWDDRSRPSADRCQNRDHPEPFTISLEERSHAFRL